MDYSEWTKYHIISSLCGGWRFFREGSKRSIMTSKDRNEVIKCALYKVNFHGGVLFVHYNDGTIDFVVDNWIG